MHVAMWGAAVFGTAALAGAAAGGGSGAPGFPTPLEAYPSAASRPLLEVLAERVSQDPFNLVATLLFVCAIVHTFLTGAFRRWAHAVQAAHEAARTGGGEAAQRSPERQRGEAVSFGAEMLHFLGEVEAVFGLWVVPLLLAITFSRGFGAAEHYLGVSVNYTEPVFVVVIMAMAATRPIVRLAEQAMARVAALGGGTAAAWWLSILTLGPILGSFITEPAAMTISALLLARRFYELGPSPRLKYATLGLLFVNVSVGGTLTHFAAPPVLMVAGAWGWDLAHMLTHFGWKAIAGIAVSNLLYFAVFRRELRQLGRAAAPRADAGPDWPIPAWVTIAHVLFMGWTVFTAHYPALFVGGFLFFIAFVAATGHHQDEINLRPAMLVGFFLAGLVVHGGLQRWWIEPLLGGLEPLALMVGATALTAFNDNAAITYLASLVPDFTAEMKYAVVAGAVTGGGLTVIANAPNPAGQSILQRFFAGGVSPLGLAVGALVPTLIVGLAYLALPS